MIRQEEGGSQNDADANRRAHRRHAICLPAELTLLDEAGLHALSERSYCVLSDISVGGVRAEIIGVAASQLRRINPGRQKVRLSFISPGLLEHRPLVCRLRWQRDNPTNLGVTLGLQFDGLSFADAELLILQVLRSAAAPRRARPLARSVLVAALVAVVAGVPAVLLWSRAHEKSYAADLALVSQRLQFAESALDHLGTSIDESERDLDKVRRDLRDCQDKLDAGDVNEEDDAPLNAGVARDSVAPADDVAHDGSAGENPAPIPVAAPNAVPLKATEAALHDPQAASR